MTVKVYTLNAFSKKENGGSLAGVVLDADKVSEEEMQLVAKEVKLPVTVFVMKSTKSNANFKFKFFTQNGEINLSGHATIAAFYLLLHKKIIKPGKYTQETKAGILNIEIKSDKTVLMNQNPPQFLDKINKREFTSLLNIPNSVLSKELPIQIISTGIKDIFIPIVSLNDLYAIKPDFDRIKKVSKKYGVVGFHLFTTETKFNDSTAHCRNLAPLYDVSEDSASGTSNAALGCYLFKHGIISGDKCKNMIFEQGYIMNKPSEIKVSLDIQDNEIIEVRVGGSASNINEQDVEVEVPVKPDDD
ncbi:PhzF family phenazine biosynthesis protein [Candidatus Woesearchaeota archaeon]|nr:PhzF family phenazine biosynthesis protein [Candidatus Woesearchaeota archaeon]MBT6520356.1 PhzF family phenazine biosynthesis protein [Candidatus Woesearchaeota archaeon]MBT7368562.1 PhzF family phenazine biosynthesis protein [Candidatus Woesearchaeota archaeon]